MPNNYPKVPVRFVDSNDEILEDFGKSADAGQRIGGTDYLPGDASAPTGSMSAQYRTPPDRVYGNVLFRRLPDGSLDLDYAMHAVVDALRKVRDGVALTSLEEAALSCCFPQNFSYLDPGVVDSVRRVNLKITHEESVLVATKVAMHLQAQMNFKHSSHAR